MKTGLLRRAAKGVARWRREWPLPAALAGILLLLPFAWAGPPRVRLGSPPEELPKARARLRRGETAGLAGRLRLLLTRHPGGPHAAEARALLAEALLADHPGGAALSEAWTVATAARAAGFEAPRIDALRREILARHLARGEARLAETRARMLFEDARVPEDGLALARLVACDARRNPGRLEEALRLAHGGAGSDPRTDSRAKLEILRLAGRYEDLVAAADRELGRFPDDPLLLLERARALVRLGREEQASSRALREAGERARDDSSRAEVALLEAEFLCRARRSESEARCRELMASAPAVAPLATLLLGLSMLEASKAEGLETLRHGLNRISDARALAAAGFDFDDFHGLLREAREREMDPSALAGYSEVSERTAVLLPEDTRLLLDLGRIAQQAGDLRVRRADGLEASGKEAEAREERRAARDHYRAGAEAFGRAALSAVGREDLRAAHGGAALAFSAAGFHARAAESYHCLLEMAPPAEAGEIVLRLAESLRRAGILSDEPDGEPGAISVLSAYVGRSISGDPLLPAALIRRGRLLADLGRREEAVGDYGRILRDFPLGIDPRAGEWSEALLGRGRELLALSVAGPEDVRRQRRREAREALEEYVERYAAEQPPRAGAVEAASLLVRLAAAEGAWREALRHLRSVEELAGDANPPSPGPSRPEFLEAVRSLKGDLYYALGDHEEAFRAYGEVYRSHARDWERLWSLMGRGRAGARLGRLEEARRDYEMGRALLEENRAAFEESFGSRGGEFWRNALAALAEETR